MQCSLLMLRGGFASEWALIMEEVMKAGRVEIVALHLANLVNSGRPQLAAVGAHALAQTLPAERVRLSAFSLQ